MSCQKKFLSNYSGCGATCLPISIDWGNGTLFRLCFHMSGFAFCTAGLSVCLTVSHGEGCRCLFAARVTLILSATRRHHSTPPPPPTRALLPFPLSLWPIPPSPKHHRLSLSALRFIPLPSHRHPNPFLYCVPAGACLAHIMEFSLVWLVSVMIVRAHYIQSSRPAPRPPVRCSGCPQPSRLLGLSCVYN